MALPLWASQVWQRQPDVQALISARSAQDARTQQAIFAGLEMQMKQQELASQQRQFQEGMAFKQEQEKNAMQTKAWEMEMAQKRMDQKALVDAANIARYNAMTANYNRQNQPAQPIQPPVSNWPTASNPDSTITKVAQPETFTPTVSNPTDLNSGSPPSAEDVLAGANPQFTIQGGLQPTGMARESIAGETPYTPIPALMNPAPLQPIPQPPTVFAPINQKPELTDAAIGFNTLTGNSNVPNAKQGQPGNPTDLLSLPENVPLVNAGGLMTMRLPGNKISYSEIDTNKDGTYKLDASGNYVPKNWSVPQDIVPKTTQTNEDKLALLDAKTARALAGKKTTLATVLGTKPKAVQDQVARIVSPLLNGDSDFDVTKIVNAINDVESNAKDASKLIVDAEKYGTAQQKSAVSSTLREMDLVSKAHEGRFNTPDKEMSAREQKAYDDEIMPLKEKLGALRSSLDEKLESITGKPMSNKPAAAPSTSTPSSNLGKLREQEGIDAAAAKTSYLKSLFKTAK